MLKQFVMGSVLSLAAASSALAAPPPSCNGLPSRAQLQTALKAAVALGPSKNGGLGFNMWATLIAPDGLVCAVAFTGADFRSQWLVSRVISAQKANTANGLSLGAGTTPATSVFGAKGLAWSTAQLYAAVQPGGSLFGLQHSNPVDTRAAYYQPNLIFPDDAAKFGTDQDPMVGLAIGGVNVFGGGVVLLKNGQKLGALGVSGDTSCTDHFVAWRVRNALGLDIFGTVQGLSGDPKHPDNIIFDILPTNPSNLGSVGVSASGFGHPKCPGAPIPDPATLPAVR